MFTISNLSKLASRFSRNNKSHYGFCTSILAPRNIVYSDVIQVYADESGSFLNLPGRTISIDPRQSISEFKQFTLQQYPDIKYIKAFDEKIVEYSETAPAFLLLKENFLLKINEEWYSVIAETDNPLFNVKQDHNIRDKTVFKLFEDSGHTMRHTATLGKFISSLMADISENAHTQVDSHIIKTIVDKNLFERSIEAKAQIEIIDMKLAFLRKKLAIFEELKTNIENKLAFKARKRLRWFSTFLFAQVLAVQYGTYAAFSWDVMEPITNLMGILDVIIAYSFWMTTNKSYSYHNIGQNYIESRRRKAYKKADFDEEEYEECKKLITLLETQRSLLSPKIDDLLRALQLLDKQKAVGDEEDD